MLKIPITASEQTAVTASVARQSISARLDDGSPRCARDDESDCASDDELDFARADDQ